jgi:hypothetical protein
MMSTHTPPTTYGLRTARSLGIAKLVQAQV